MFALSPPAAAAGVVCCVQACRGCAHRKARSADPDVDRAVEPVGGVRVVPKFGVDRDEPEAAAHEVRHGVQGGKDAVVVVVVGARVVFVASAAAAAGGAAAGGVVAVIRKWIGYAVVPEGYYAGVTFV